MKKGEIRKGLLSLVSYGYEKSMIYVRGSIKHCTFNA